MVGVRPGNSDPKGKAVNDMDRIPETIMFGGKERKVEPGWSNWYKIRIGKLGTLDIHDCGKSGFQAFCNTIIPRCNAQGFTFHEAVSSLEIAMNDYLEALGVELGYVSFDKSR